METLETTPAEQFANDFLLIADNNSQEFYAELRESAKNAQGVAELSDTLRDEWETLVEQVGEAVEKHVSDIARDFVVQILGGWGSRPFDLIARELINRLKDGE